jgi:hypothetical protein
MARTLSTYVSLWGEASELVTLTPGDELPGWAVGRVGEHCLVPAADSEDSEDSAEDQDPADSDADGETDDEDRDETEDADGEEPAATDAAPDFTAAVPRRGRSRK